MSNHIIGNKVTLSNSIYQHHQFNSNSISQFIQVQIQSFYSIGNKKPYLIRPIQSVRVIKKPKRKCNQ